MLLLKLSRYISKPCFGFFFLCVWFFFRGRGGWAHVELSTTGTYLEFLFSTNESLIWTFQYIQIFIFIFC